MEIKIGIRHISREISIDTNETAEKVRSKVTHRFRLQRLNSAAARPQPPVSVPCGCGLLHFYNEYFSALSQRLKMRFVLRRVNI